MGLKDYKKFKKRQELLETLSSFGITEDDLKLLPKALKMIKEKEIEISHQSKSLTEDEKQKIKEEYKDKITPESVIKAFASTTEEFYPNGRA